MAKRYLVGLIGANIQRSLSPALHEDAFAAAGLTGHYHLMDLDQLGRRAELGRLLEAVRLLGFAGVNITHPCKESILPLLDDVAADTAEVGAVNTVVIDPTGRTRGHNTDRAGFSKAFASALGRAAIEGQAALLVGAGGAGRAVAHALFDLGAASIAIYDKDQQRAKSLAEALAARAMKRGVSVATDVAAAARGVAGAVNATPVGMTGYPGQPIPSEALRPELWIADVVYTPLETQLVAAARRKGCRVMTGGGMCVHQAAAAFHLFTGIEPDLSRMHRLFDALCAERDARIAAVG
jgi:shikimate dehydrogenase